MSVAARYLVEKTPSRNQKVTQKSRNYPKKNINKVIQRDSSFKSPFWLQSLLIIQQSSGAIAFVTIVIMFTLYASIVYTQQMWSKEYRKLKSLQRQERILVQTNETIKNDLADLAKKSSTGLVPLDSQKSVFLTPTPIKSTQRSQKRRQEKEIQPLKNIPLGY